MTSGIDAGEFGAWLRQAREALRGRGGSTVPCGDCTGCCTSSYSLEVRPSDAAVLERIPAKSLYRPLGSAPRNWTVRPNADGTCPMLDCGRCSIYAQRPQTCLDYDCRVFAAAGIDAGGEDKAVINRRVRQWRFRFDSDADLRAHAAIRAAAAFIRDEHQRFPPGIAPRNALGIAALALRVYPVFLPPGPPGEPADIVRAIIEEPCT
ncbi:MAG TPA: YkgJ family cysteine cluster protein [Steroidobacteraceae bacterium]|nr:YkgJ family cysteine cluster protein [Steroidobacteraceae bacterium]